MRNARSPEAQPQEPVDAACPVGCGPLSHHRARRVPQEARRSHRARTNRARPSRATSSSVWHRLGELKPKASAAVVHPLQPQLEAEPGCFTSTCQCWNPRRGGRSSAAVLREEAGSGGVGTWPMGAAGTSADASRSSSSPCALLRCGGEERRPPRCASCWIESLAGDEGFRVGVWGNAVLGRRQPGHPPSLPIIPLPCCSS